MLITSDKKLDISILNEIDKSGITYILKNLKFHNINSDFVKYTFTQGASFSDSKGMVYIIDLQNFTEHEGKYNKINHIDSDWYLFKGI